MLPCPSPSVPLPFIDPAAPAASASVGPVSDAPHTPPDPDTATPVESDATSPVDLDAVGRDLAAVERALERLSDGTYWTDEVTGEPIPDHVLAADPTARRA